MYESKYVCIYVCMSLSMYVCCVMYSCPSVYLNDACLSVYLASKYTLYCTGKIRKISEVSSYVLLVSLVSSDITDIQCILKRGLVGQFCFKVILQYIKLLLFYLIINIIVSIYSSLYIIHVNSPFVSFIILIWYQL